MAFYKVLGEGLKSKHAATLVRQQLTLPATIQISYTRLYMLLNATVDLYLLHVLLFVCTT